MKRPRQALAIVVLLGLASLTAGAAPSPADQALQVLDRYLDAVNQRDLAAWSAAHHDQCLVVGPAGELHLYERPGEVPPLWESPQAGAFHKMIARWEGREVVGASADKVHVRTRLRLMGPDLLCILDGIYILTDHDGWAISVVSEMSPLVRSSKGKAGGDLSAPERADLEAKALAVLDEFMATFNGRDGQAHLATHNFPHFRLANAELKITDRDSTLVGGPLFFSLLKLSTGLKWDHSGWDERKVVQVSAAKLHVLTRYSRYTSDDQKFATYDSLYVLTLQDGHWGVKGRSSFAPL